MPTSAPHACGTPRCPNLAPAGKPRCGSCSTSHETKDRARRGSSAERGYGSRWQKYRLRFLAEHPLCLECSEEQPPRVTAATVVDHVKAHKGDPVLMWDPKNHRPACKPHHDRRTDEGDFGRPIPKEQHGDPR